MSEWTQETWGMFFDLLDKGWPGRLEPGADRAYQLLLDGTDPDRVVAGLRRLLHRGARFRPSAAEILDAGRQDPGRPTFAEAVRLIFGPSGVLQARPAQRRYSDPGERDRLYQQAALDRAAQMHPLIGAFIQSQGLERLRALHLQDPEYGELRRRELEAEWNAMVDRINDRQIAVEALPAGDARRGELAPFDPLAALRKRPPTMLPAPAQQPQEVAAGHDEGEGPR